MFNPFLQNYQQRLGSWKQVRHQIADEVTTEAKIDTALQFWRHAPIESRVIDWDDSSTWPAPWDLLHDNRYCSSTTSLGLAYTLLLSRVSQFEDLQLCLITDREHSIQKMVTVTNGWCLNHGFVDRVASNSLKTMSVQHKWKWNEKSWQKV
jgi:hypothetical protein